MSAKGSSAQLVSDFARAGNRGLRHGRRAARARARQGSAPRHAFGPSYHSLRVRSFELGSKLALTAGSLALLLLSACGDGEDAPPCSVISNDDGSSTLRCPDGSEVQISNGTDGDDGSDGTNGRGGEDGANGVDGERGLTGEAGEGCTSSEKVDHTVTITCDEFTNTIVDGADGADGTSCTIESAPGGASSIVCNDGTSYPIVDGVDGSSCSVADGGQGTHVISCTDGTIATVRDGVDGENGIDGSDCSVANNGNGTFTLSCEDGTAVTWNAPRSACSLRFDDAYDDGAGNPGGFYASGGVVFGGQPSTIVGGASRDASSNGVEGTAGAAAVLLSAGTTSVGFSPGVRSVAVDLIRALADAPDVTVNAFRGTTLVATVNVSLSAAEPLRTVRLEGFAMDSINVVSSVELGLDNVRYDGVTCPTE